MVAWGQVRGYQEAIKWGLLAGLALDFLSVAPPGTYTLALSLSATIATSSMGLGIEGAPLQVGAVAAATLLYRALALAILWLSGVTVIWDFGLAEEAVASAALNGLLAPFVCWLLHGINRRIHSGLKQELEA